MEARSVKVAGLVSLTRLNFPFWVRGLTGTAMLVA